MNLPNWTTDRFAFFAGCLCGHAPENVRAGIRLVPSPDQLFYVALVKFLKPHIAEDKWQECIDQTNSAFGQET